MIIFNYTIATLVAFGLSISLIVMSQPLQGNMISIETYNILLVFQLLTVSVVLIVSVLILFKKMEEFEQNLHK